MPYPALHTCSSDSPLFRRVFIPAPLLPFFQVDGCTNKNNLWTALENVIQYSDDGDALGEWGPADVTKIDLPATCTGALYLLPGHQDVSAYEQKVSVAYSSKLNFEPATPGAWNKLITLTAHKCGADVVIVDCNPHVGALNMHIVLTSDYLFLPCTPDFHSHDAIKSLPPVLRGWAITRKAARTTLVHSDELASDLQIPGRNPRILGASIMKFTHRNGRLARSFGYWTDLIQNALRAANTTIHATPALEGMAGNPEEPDTWPSILVDMPDFCSLGALSHYYGLPVFALGPDLMGDWNADTGAMQSYGGHVKAGMNKSVMDFQALFKSFIQKVGSKVARGPFQVSFVDGNINVSDRRSYLPFRC